MHVAWPCLIPQEDLRITPEQDPPHCGHAPYLSAQSNREDEGLALITPQQIPCLTNACMIRFPNACAHRTWPCPIVKTKGRPLSTDESNLVPSVSLPCVRAHANVSLEDLSGLDGRPNCQIRDRSHYTMTYASPCECLIAQSI